MQTVAKVIDGKLKLVEIPDERYFTEKCLDSDNYAVYDRTTGKQVVNGTINKMHEMCKRYNR